MVVSLDRLSKRSPKFTHMPTEDFDPIEQVAGEAGYCQGVFRKFFLLPSIKRTCPTWIGRLRVIILRCMLRVERFVALSIRQFLKGTLMIMRSTIARLARAALWTGAGLAMASGLASAASAAPITYVLTGDFIGPSQASVAFTWTITGDTTSVTSIQGFPAVPSITDVLNIAGIGSVLPAEQVFVVAADIDNAAAFVDLAGSAGVEWTATELSTWGALTPIGPLNVAFLAAAPLPTNLGDLNVTGGSNLVFTATAGTQIPEPGALWLLLGGIVGLIAYSAVRATPKDAV